MSQGSELEPVVGELCYHVAYLMGRSQAYEIYLQSLAGVLVEKFPELRESFKEKFVDVCDLHRPMIKDKVTLESFDETVKGLTQHFLLMRAGGLMKDE
jgi:hypothetical protein